MKKVLFYTNQFFGQIGGEEAAYTEPQIHEGPKGNANAFAPQLKDAKIVATILCGDNYYAENMETCRAFIREQVEAYHPDMLLAGPAFNAGRFGIACADACAFVQEQLGVQSLTAMYEENPALEMYRKSIYIMQAGKSAASMTKDAKRMADFANKLLAGEPVGLPKEEGYFPKGRRINVFAEKNGAVRAVDMLLAKIKGEPFETELEISMYDKVQPSTPVKDLRKAKVALLTSGGIVPRGNPDHIPAATAKVWGRYDLSGMTRLDAGDWESVHAGYDPVYANDDPNRVAPYNTMKELEKEGIIGEVYPYLCSTTGNSTSVADATRMGDEMVRQLKADGVEAVILTST
jgi:glycine reductase